MLLPNVRANLVSLGTTKASLHTNSSKAHNHVYRFIGNGMRKKKGIEEKGKEVKF